MFTGQPGSAPRAASALDDFDRFNAMLDQGFGQVFDPEPGEFGGISPMLLARFKVAQLEPRTERRRVRTVANGLSARTVRRCRRGRSFSAARLGKGGFLRTRTAAPPPGPGIVTQAAEARGSIPRAGEIPPIVDSRCPC